MILPGARDRPRDCRAWYVALYRAQRLGAITQFFVGENLERFRDADSRAGPTRGSTCRCSRRSLSVGAAGARAARTAWRRRPSGESRTRAIRRLLWIWIVVIVGVFSLSQSKQDLYIFPVCRGGRADCGHAGRLRPDHRHRGVRVLLGILRRAALSGRRRSGWLFTTAITPSRAPPWRAGSLVVTP